MKNKEQEKCLRIKCLLDITLGLGLACINLESSTSDIDFRMYYPERRG